MKKLSILVPIFNEEPTARKLLDLVLDFKLEGWETEVVVVESNSTDNSRAIVQEYEKAGRIKAVYEERPQGKGHAMKTGFPHLTGDVILVQDADLEYKVSDYPTLLKPFEDDKTDFVLGSRHLGAGSWAIRTFITEGASARLINLGGLLYAGLFNLLYGTHLTDPATMFKVFRRKCIEGITWRSNWFDLDWEIVAKLVLRGYVPVEVPVSYKSRSVEEGKKIRFWRDGTLVALAIIRFRFFD